MKNPIQLVVLLLITSLLFCCKSDSRLVKGDLSFKLVSIISPEGMSNEQAHQIEILLASDADSTTLKQSQIGLDYFKKLKKHKLLQNPYIRLKNAESDCKTIFLSKTEHQKLKKYSLAYLRKNKKRLEIELKIIELDSAIYYSEQIISCKEVSGETYIEK